MAAGSDDETSETSDSSRSDAENACGQAVPAPVPLPIGPELDLHAFHPRDVASCVEEFIRAAAEAGILRVRLVHGRGRGVQRGIVQATLDRHPYVTEFWDDASSHLGATCAKLALPPDRTQPSDSD
jgi:dsDNA-specific endonuclease/ATPase MutS2